MPRMAIPGFYRARYAKKPGVSQAETFMDCGRKNPCPGRCATNPLRNKCFARCQLEKSHDSLQSRTTGAIVNPEI